jgi:transcriptional regulator with XRE-family HTH domain
MNNVDGRILELSTTLKQLGLVKSQAEFCREIGFMKQNIRKVKLGLAHFSTEHFDLICKTYNVDANYLIGRQVSPFLKTKLLLKKA